MVKHDNRLFAFGCSFTRYDTDTYADYIGKNYKEFYNYGNPGSGNAQIATTLSEKILEHDINKNDRVAAEIGYAKLQRIALVHQILPVDRYHQIIATAKERTH